ncbi:hypothetical protein BO78DRAFT_408473 [Aspergillus sclerotiicarbonarius CBS 121057]|uniref:Uncharacterized protein n=1 Tax=Aspergillus sclerotiicarbonarius (strain CBS 121057 / IBT 28362) TaxID=1448318 RepID=A0A319FEZ7_ASPSB|nr:hypothetical protein BO78DRAFT_408473 [Aspergillus sclerotiicarbonarius CBS 121057]
MVSKAIGCLHLPKLSSYQQSPSCDWGQLTLPVMFCMEGNLPRLGPWGCNMISTNAVSLQREGSETTNVFDPGLVRNELLQTFPPHLTRVAHWAPVFHPTSGNKYQATRSLDCRPSTFPQPKRLNFLSSLSRLLVNPPTGRLGALSPPLISLTWTSGTLG